MAKVQVIKGTGKGKVTDAMKKEVETALASHKGPFRYASPQSMNHERFVALIKQGILYRPYASRYGIETE